MTTWWREHNRTSDSWVFPDHLVALLDDVESRFITAGGHRQAWPDPHTDRDPVEDEYSRVSRPERYVILEARRQAWVDALQRRGLACITARPDSPSALDQACPNGAADLT